MTPEERATEVVAGVLMLDGNLGFKTKQAEKWIAAAIREAERDMQRRCIQVVMQGGPLRDVRDIAAAIEALDTERKSPDERG